MRYFIYKILIWHKSIGINMNVSIPEDLDLEMKGPFQRNYKECKE